MVDDVRDITETAESKASQEVLDRARLARERREVEQRKRLDELRAHAAAAQAQREKRDEERRRRQAEQRARDDDRRLQVEERKRAIWEASVSRREALLQRERDRTERLERQRAARSAPRPAFAFGSSTPRLLEPLDSAGFFWAARSTNPIDQMNFFESLAASTTNVMFASAPLTRRASALQLDSSDTDNKDEGDRTPVPAMWSSVARRRTDLVPTLPAPRAPGRAYSMTRLDKLPHTPTTHLSRTQSRSGDTTPGSRPGSALSNATGAGAGAGVVRRISSAPRKPRPASIAGTGVNTPRGGIGAATEPQSQSAATTPSVSRDSTLVGDVTRRVTPRRARPLSLHAPNKSLTPSAPGEGKPPLHRKPKPSKDHDKTPRGKSLSASPGRALSPSPGRALSPSPSRAKHYLHKDLAHKLEPETTTRVQVSAAEVTHKLHALQKTNETQTQETVAETNESKSDKPTEVTQHDDIPTENQRDDKPTEIQDKSEVQDNKSEPQDNKSELQDNKSELQDNKPEIQEKTEVQEKKDVREDKKPEDKKLIEQKKEEKREEKKEPSLEKTDDSEMTASMSRRITTEEQAKAALAERRRRAREELERQAELERLRLQREAEEEAERQRLEEERQLREEQEARELAQLQRRMDEEKLRKAIEVQQQLEREEAERKAREEVERQQKLKEEEEKRKAAEEAEKLRREEAEREEKERLARKQRVEAIMARTRLRKAEEDKKQQESKQSNLSAPQESTPATEPVDNVTATVTTTTTVTEHSHVDNGSSDNGNVATGDLLGFTSQTESEKVETKIAAEIGAGDAPVQTALPTQDVDIHNNGNTDHSLPSQPLASEDKPVEPPKNPQESNNGNTLTSLSANFIQNEVSANFIQNEVAANEATQKLPEKIIDDDFTTHNGHGTLNHPLTLQNAI